MTKTGANKIVRWFKKNFGCRDWKIKILWCPAGASDGQVRALGSCDPDLPYRAVKIRIDLEEHKYRIKHDADTTPEHTLMHELIHCFFAECGIDDNGDSSEYGVNQLASILVKQYRADNG